MDSILKRQIEEILEQAEVEVEEQSGRFFRQALAIDIPIEDSPWLKSMFKFSAIFLELAYGNKRRAKQALPWLLFSLGIAYERHHQK